MGWTSWIVKFENKKEAYIEWQVFLACAKKYGEIVPLPHSDMSYELSMKNPIGEYVGIHGSPSSGVYAIAIDKPIENEYIRPFVFDFLNTFDMVTCDQNFLAGFSCKDLRHDIPDKTLTEGVTIVTRANELFI